MKSSSCDTVKFQFVKLYGVQTLIENASITLKFAPIVKWYQNFRLLTKKQAGLFRFHVASHKNFPFVFFLHSIDKWFHSYYNVSVKAKVAKKPY